MQDEGTACGVADDWICCRAGFDTIVDIVVPNNFCVFGGAEEVSDHEGDNST